jgi:hypothetical protein
MIEVWKAVVGFEGFYEVSNLARVKSLERWEDRQSIGGVLYKFLRKELIRKQILGQYGYLRIILRKEGKSTYCSIHRLIADAFIDNPWNKPYVNHINGIKHDNRIENLEWCTAKENSLHSFSNGLQVMPKGAENSRSIPISQFTNEGRWVRDWAGATEVQRETGFHQATISACIKGKGKTAHGFIWKKLSG